MPQNTNTMTNTQAQSANLVTTTLNPEDFTGINLESLKNILIEKCLDKIGNDYELEGDVKHEFSNELHYVYFTALPIKDGYNKQMHRYYKLVFSMLLFDNYYFDSNVIDKTANYTIQDVKNSFKGLLSHLSNLTSDSYKPKF